MATLALAPSSPASSPSLSPCRSRATSWSLPPTDVGAGLLAHRKSLSTAAGPSTARKRMLSKDDILRSHLIPSSQKDAILERQQQLEYLLTQDDRKSKGFEVHGVTPADHMVAAEQLARMTMVLDWYTDWSEKKTGAGDYGRVDGGNPGEIESLATELLDAALCASGWQRTWDQPCFVTTLCLRGKEEEVAELATWCLRKFGKLFVHSTSTFLELWQGPTQLQGNPLSKLDEPRARDVPAALERLHMQLPGKGRFRAHNDIFHLADARTRAHNDLDHAVWKVCANDAKTPWKSLAVEWPPRHGLAGYALMDKLPHAEKAAISVWTGSMGAMASRVMRNFLHLWCLRCWRVRRSQSRLVATRILDALFMHFPGIFIVLPVEAWIAWTEERVPKDASIREKVQKAWSFFLEKEVPEGIFCGQVREERAVEGSFKRHRSLTCGQFVAF